MFRDMGEDIQSLGRTSVRSMLAMLKDCQEKVFGESEESKE